MLSSFHLRAASHRPLRATWAKTAAPTRLAVSLQYERHSSLNEASFRMHSSQNKMASNINQNCHIFYPKLIESMAYCEEVHSLISTEIKRRLRIMHLHLGPLNINFHCVEKWIDAKWNGPLVGYLSSKTLSLSFERCAIYPRCL